MKEQLKFCLAINCIFFTFQTLYAQNNIEIGAFGGISYYIGNINPTQQFYSPSRAFGFTVGYVLNDRETFRFLINNGQFTGADRDFTNEYQQVRNLSFSTTLIDMDAIYEFNYLPFHYKERRHAFTPFSFVGIGYEVLLQSTYNIPNNIVVPFGIGIKYLLNKRTTVGAEWSFRKTFQNQIDGVGNPGGNQYKSILNNNDWYSYAGFFISFRLFGNGNCAVYQ